MWVFFILKTEEAEVIKYYCECPYLKGHAQVQNQQKIGDFFGFLIWPYDVNMSID